MAKSTGRKQQTKKVKQRSQAKSPTKKVRKTSAFSENFINKIDELNLPIIVLLVVFVYVWLVNAWICDDAYITFRTVDNFVNGYGLTWNPGERVQAYTHPLWMFLVSILYFFTNEAFLTSFVLTLLLSFSAVYFGIIKNADNRFNTVFGMIILIFSKAFIDYTSSGLENPLTFLLMAIFVYIFFKYQGGKKMFWLSIITALGMLTRLDNAIFFLPPLLFFLIDKFSIKKIGSMIIGFIPLIIWEIFSVIYYGYPFPNTYYAKMNTGLPKSEYFAQGFAYMKNSLLLDPPTLIVIILSIVVFILIKKRKTYIPFAISLLLYLLYVINIGGGFMSGRFLAAPLFFASAVLVTFDMRKLFDGLTFYQLATAALIILLGMLPGRAPIMSWINFGGQKDREEASDQDNPWAHIPFSDMHGIVDERAFYYQTCGLMSNLVNGSTEPRFMWVDHAKKTRKTDVPLLVRSSVGMFGYYVGQEYYIIDHLGLGTAFTARLDVEEDPELPEPGWRIGHFKRKNPAGYEHTVMTDSNRFENEDLGRLYEHVQNVITGDIWNAERWRHIRNLNFGGYDHLVPEDYKKSEFPSLKYAVPEYMPTYYNNLALYLLRREDSSLALNYFDRSLEHDPTNKTAVRNKFVLRCMLKGYQDALNFMKEHVKKHRSAAAVYLGLGEYFFRHDKKELAVHMFRLNAEKAPNAYTSLINLYDYYKSVNMPDSAAYFAERYRAMGGRIE